MKEIAGMQEVPGYALKVVELEQVMADYFLKMSDDFILIDTFYDDATAYLVPDATVGDIGPNRLRKALLLFWTKFRECLDVDLSRLMLVQGRYKLQTIIGNTIRVEDAPLVTRTKVVGATIVYTFTFHPELFGFYSKVGMKDLGATYPQEQVELNIDYNNEFLAEVPDAVEVVLEVWWAGLVGTGDFTFGLVGNVLTVEKLTGDMAGDDLYIYGTKDEEVTEPVLAIVLVKNN